MTNRAKSVHVELPITYIRLLEKMVEDKLYPNISEAIRVAVRDLLKYHRYWPESS